VWLLRAVLQWQARLGAQAEAWAVLPQVLFDGVGGWADEGCFQRHIFICEVERGWRLQQRPVKCCCSCLHLALPQSPRRWRRLQQ
jgi:hypothetical protein